MGQRVGGPHLLLVSQLIRQAPGLARRAAAHDGEAIRAHARIHRHRLSARDAVEHVDAVDARGQVVADRDARLVGGGAVFGRRVGHPTRDVVRIEFDHRDRRHRDVHAADEGLFRLDLGGQGGAEQGHRWDLGGRLDLGLLGRLGAALEDHEGQRERYGQRGAEQRVRIHHAIGLVQIGPIGDDRLDVHRRHVKGVALGAEVEIHARRRHARAVAIGVEALEREPAIGRVRTAGELPDPLQRLVRLGLKEIVVDSERQRLLGAELGVLQRQAERRALGPHRIRQRHGDAGLDVAFARAIQGRHGDAQKAL